MQMLENKKNKHLRNRKIIKISEKRKKCPKIGNNSRKTQKQFKIEQNSRTPMQRQATAEQEKKRPKKYV